VAARRALLGQADGLDMTNNKPEFTRGGMFIDPDLLSNPAAFNRATFTLTYSTVPEPGALGLIAALAGTSCMLLRFRGRRALKKKREIEN